MNRGSSLPKPMALWESFRQPWRRSPRPVERFPASSRPITSQMAVTVIGLGRDYLGFRARFSTAESPVFAVAFWDRLLWDRLRALPLTLCYISQQNSAGCPVNGIGN